MRRSSAGSLGDWVGSGTGKWPLPSACGLPLQHGTLIGVGIDGRSLMRHESAGVGRGSIGAVQLPAELAEQGRLLPSMMGRVGDAPDQDPRAGADHLEESDLVLPPGMILRAQRVHSARRILGVTTEELEPNLARGERWRANVDPEHVAKPEILA